MCVCVCVDIYIYKNIYINRHIYICVYVCIQKRICVCIYIYIYIYSVYIYIHIYTHIYIYTGMYIYIYIYMYVFMNTLINAHAHTHTHIYIYIYIYIDRKQNKTKKYVNKSKKYNHCTELGELNARAQTHTHTHTHTHIYIYMPCACVCKLRHKQDGPLFSFFLFSFATTLFNPPKCPPLIAIHSPLHSNVDFRGLVGQGWWKLPPLTFPRPLTAVQRGNVFSPSHQKHICLEPTDDREVKVMMPETLETNAANIYISAFLELGRMRMRQWENVVCRPHISWFL